MKKLILIAPSILSADFSRLRDEISAIEQAGANLIHLDIMDGHYVPNLTFGYIIAETVGKLTSLPMDAHLMVSNPADYIERMAKSGVQYISFHPETVYHPHRLIQAIKNKNMKAGLALNPGFSLSMISDFLPDLDYILLMSVNPGYSGQNFIPSVIGKISQLKEKLRAIGSPALIEVDGGINNTNVKQLAEAGADIIVSASYIFSAADYSEAIRSLKNV